MDGLFLHMSASKILESLSHTCIQGIHGRATKDFHTWKKGHHYGLLWKKKKKKKTQIAAVILPSLRRLHVDLVESNYAEDENPDTEIIGKKRPEGGDRFSNGDLEREDECGICLEPCTKMVLPNCCHAMCINCYRDWNMRSESCPFCRGSIKRVKSRDLWVLTCSDDVVDTKTVSTEDFLCFNHCISSLPKDFPEAFFLMQYEYLL
ncbi:hypothetical protein CsSME_00036780 [Camellia sinensis var. sinensis]